MPLDPAIYSAFAPKQTSAIDTLAALGQVDAQRGTNALQQLQIAMGQGQLQDAQQARTDRNALYQLLSSPTFNRAAPDMQQQLYRVAPTQAAGVIKGWQDQDQAAAKLAETKAATGKDQAQASHFNAQTQGLTLDQQIKRRQDHVSQLAGVADVPSAVQWINDAVRSGELPMDRATQVIQQLQSGQMPVRQWVQQAMMNGLSLLDQIREQRLLGDQTETIRHNRTTEATSAGQLSVAQGRLAVERAREGREAAAPRGQVVQTDQGLMLVDPRAGTAAPIAGPGGQQLSKPLKDIPSGTNAGIISNAQNIARAQQALDLLDGKTVGALQGDPAATGAKGYLPQGVLNRLDPKGVDTRAMIADLGSMVLHDRSGAAVTASESPRLMPFIPQATDDAATVKKKLTRFLQVFQQEQQALAESYSADQGYRPNPILTKGAKPRSAGNAYGMLPSSDDIAAELARRGGR